MRKRLARKGSTDPASVGKRLAARRKLKMAFLLPTDTGSVGSD